MPVFDNVISKLQYGVADLITSSALILKYYKSIYRLLFMLLQSQEADKEEIIATTSAGNKSPVHFKHWRLNNCYWNGLFQYYVAEHHLLWAIMTLAK